jgi:5'-nucleotidase / UDP-sugar diphosphatase
MRNKIFRRAVPWRLLAGSVLGALVLGGCATHSSAPPRFKPLELHIAHLNDHHSQLEPLPHTELKLDGVPTQVELGGMARQAAVFKALAGTPNLLRLHAGDAITGKLYFSGAQYSLYHTAFKGEADARLMNHLCFDAFVPGNHEFDDGDAALQGFLQALAAPANGGGHDCQTATVAANIVPQAGTALAPNGDVPHLQPYTVKTIDGVDVGIIGLLPGSKIAQSSRPLPSTQFLDATAAAQQAIDALKARGIRHIVLLSHLGYPADRALAAQLTDVDVVIGGDSHSLLGDFSAVGLPATSGDYPTLVKNKSGETVCIGQAWEYAKAYGLMRVQFDAQGAVAQCSGQARLVIGDDFRRQDSTGVWQPLDDTAREALRQRLESVPAVHVVAPDTAAAHALSAYTAQVEAQKSATIGHATEALCLVRVPGEGTNRSGGVAGCEAAHTLARGSDVAQVVAAAFLRASPRADVALQNAGGVRAPIAAGPISMNTASTLLPFNNVLVELELSGAQLVATLEDAVAHHLDQGQSSGAHPYAAGLRWHLDLRQARGQRFSCVQVKDKATGSWAAIDPARRYVLVTNDFIAAGKDGYATLGQLYQRGAYVNTYRFYTQSLVDHVQAQGTLTRPAAGDYSHQQVIGPDGVALR